LGRDSSRAAKKPPHSLSSSAYRQKTNAADQRLNAAYKALQARIEAAQRQPLLSEQRLWVQYRDANCGFYGTQDGSIRQVQAAECIRSMTEDRARELEKAMEFD
jgi:uncharacterized protein YecT (DUF1311 family)